MKKYTYTVEFATDDPLSFKEQNNLAVALRYLIIKESSEEVSVAVSHKVTDLNVAEATKFREDNA